MLHVFWAVSVTKISVACTYIIFLVAKKFNLFILLGPGSHSSLKLKVDFKFKVYDFMSKVSKKKKYLGPVVHSIVSLTSSLRGQLVKCFTAV